MLISIATARSECITKHKNKANCNVGYIVPDLIDFFLAIIQNRPEHRLKKEIFIFVKDIVLAKKIVCY